MTESMKIQIPIMPVITDLVDYIKPDQDETGQSG
jgi:hypothetical protein